MRCFVFILTVLFCSFSLWGQESSESVTAEGEIPAVSEIPAGDEGLAGDSPVLENPPVPAGEPTPAPGPARPFPPEAITDSIETAVSRDASAFTFPERLGLALVIVAVQILLVMLLWRLCRFFAKKIQEAGGEKIKPLTFKKYKLLNTKQIINILLFFLRIFKYIVTAFQFFITVPLVFSLFPATKDLASILFGYIFIPLKNIALGAVHFIPNLITILMIVFITRYVLRGLKFFSLQISRGRLVIPGFYADWAEPTFNILRFLLWAFTVAIVYPYLPLADSRIFQGVSVFVGVIISLGSSSAIGNLMAGLVITYMRPFKTGDRIQIKDTTGFVVEKSLMVVRVKTNKNEYVTFPNLMILSSSIINYNTSSDEDEEGLVLYSSVTFGYDTPWQTVHRILIDAALATGHVQKSPKPFVLQTALDDFYCRYQINFYTKEVSRVSAIYSELHENIQEGFRAEGLNMTAAHYRINLPPEQPAAILPSAEKGAARALVPKKRAVKTGKK
ncbi:MAG: mechanosensitive ion channel family protein [Treponema sp.]|jgi:small-conductance mechanosensitive channel|nr:mechanosensitive ion channel family protein [Treponema sp.]